MKYATLNDIENRMPWVLDSPGNRGRVELIVVRPQIDRREVLSQVLFSPETGVAGDNWQNQCWKTLSNGRADPVVQVAVMNARMIDVLTGDKNHWPLAGDQLFVDFDLSVNNLSPGAQLQTGNTVLEITTEPHRACDKFKQRFGDVAKQYVNSAQGDALRLRGVYAKIISTGEVSIGDIIHKL